MSEKCKEELFWEINKRKMAFSGVLTLYVSEREGEWKERTSFGVASSWDHLGHWESSSAKPASSVPPQSREQPPSSIQFKEAFPPHKSPTRPLLLVSVFGEEYKYSYVLFVQLPFKIGILSSQKRQNPNCVTDAARPCCLL